MFNPPPKLSYAKVRNKSKNKSDATSQQKIVFQNQSSTDIFSHLNQDNLNYIKKQIKNKKAQTPQVQPQTNQQVNSNKQQQIKQEAISNQVKIQNVSIKNQKSNQQGSNTLQKSKKTPAPLNIMTLSQRVYQKYKNQNQVIETDPQYEQTLRQTEVDDSDIRFLNQKFSRQFSPKKNKNQQLIKVNPVMSSNQQKSPMVIISKQSVRKQSKQYISRSPRKLSIQQTQRFKTYHEDYSYKHNIHQDMYGSVSNGQKIQKLSQLNLNSYPAQTNDFLYFLESYIDDIGENAQIDEKNSIQKLLRNKKQKSNMEHSSDLIQYKEKRHLNTFQQQFKRQKPDILKKQIHTYRPKSRKKPLQSNRRLKYTETYEQDQEKDSQLESAYAYNQNSNQLFKDGSEFNKYRLDSKSNDKDIIRLLQKELVEERKDSILLAKQLERYKIEENQQKKQIFLLSGTISELKKQVEYLEDQLMKTNQKNQRIIKMINSIESKNNKKLNQEKEKYNDKLFLQPKAKESKLYSSDKYSSNQLFFGQKFSIDKEIQANLHLKEYRKQGAKDFYKKKKHNVQNFQQTSQQQQTLRRFQNEQKYLQKLNSKSKGQYKKFNIQDLEADDFNETDLKILNIRNKNFTKSQQNSSRKAKMPSNQLQNYRQIKQQNRYSIQKMKAQYENFKSQRRKYNNNFLLAS